MLTNFTIEKLGISQSMSQISIAPGCGSKINVMQSTFSRYFRPFYLSFSPLSTAAFGRSFFCKFLEHPIEVSSLSYLNNRITSSIIAGTPSSLSIDRCIFTNCQTSTSGGGFLLNCSSTSLYLHKTSFDKCYAAGSSLVGSATIVGGAAFASYSSSLNMSHVCIHAGNAPNGCGGFYATTPSGSSIEINLSNVDSCTNISYYTDYGTCRTWRTNISNDYSPLRFCFHNGNCPINGTIYFVTFFSCNGMFVYSPSTSSQPQTSQNCNFVNNTAGIRGLILNWNIFTFDTFVFYQNTNTSVSGANAGNALYLVNCVSDCLISGCVNSTTGCNFNCLSPSTNSVNPSFNCYVTSKLFTDSTSQYLLRFNGVIAFTILQSIGC